MTRILWDQVGEKVYETGLDRGVLYPEGGNGVVWNGLTSLDETFDDETTPLYYDGIKYHDQVSVGDFAGTLGAFTYPDELTELEGDLSLGGGLSVDGQRVKHFHLSYRTLVGNDVEGTDLGYRIHILYNLTAIVADEINNTLTNETSPNDFSWALTSVPVALEGFRPTAHVIIDSRQLPEAELGNIELILYGSEYNEPYVPNIDLFMTMGVLTIIDNGDGTWTAIGPPSMITMLNPTTFQIDGVEGVYLDADTYQIQSTD